MASTGAVLARSRVGIQQLVETTLTDVRLSANQQRREHVRVISFLDEIAVPARMNAARAILPPIGLMS